MGEGAATAAGAARAAGTAPATAAGGAITSGATAARIAPGATVAGIAPAATATGTTPGAVTGRLRVTLPLLEAALFPEKREVQVTCIQPGLSKNGNYYAPAVVAALAPLFEGARAFADHPGPGDRPERSVRDIVGYYHSPHVGDGGALRATLKISRNAEWLWTLVEEALADGRPDLLGVSIDADARCAPGRLDGRAIRVVEAITRLNSCDVVTRASAGGAFERVLQSDGSAGVEEADRQSWWDTFQPSNEAAVQLQDVSAAAGAPVGSMQRAAPLDSGTVPPVQEGPTVAADIRGGRVMVGDTYIAEGVSRVDPNETNTAVAGGATAAAAGPPSPATMAVVEGATGATRATDELVALRESLVAERTALATEREAFSAIREEILRDRRVLECERALQTALKGSSLPPAVVAKVERRFSGRVFESAELNGAIDEERATLAELTDAGIIRGMGYEKTIAVGLNERDRIQKAFDQLFDLQEGERVPAFGGIQEAYITVTGDHTISGVSAQEKVREADVTTASFSYLLGTSMNKRLLKDYQAWPSEWQKFCTVTPIKDFKQQDRVRLGAFGSLSTVPEDTAYTTLTLSDTRAIYTPTKRGNLVAVTRETIINDDLYAIRQIPGKLAVAAAFTLAEFVYGFLTATGNIYDGSPLFTNGGAHGNSAVVTPGTLNTGAGLSSAAMQTGVTRMRRQTNLANKPIGLKPRYLIVAPDLEWQAMTIVKSAGAPGSNNNDINPMLGYAEVVIAPQLTSPTGWYLAADPRVVDTIEIGFVGGQMNPVLFIQDQPLFGANFTNDVISYKVRHEYGGAVVDFRGFYQGNN